MDRDITYLSLTLGGLSLALLALGADLFRVRRQRAMDEAPPATLSQLLAQTPPMPPPSPATRPPPVADPVQPPLPAPAPPPAVQAGEAASPAEAFIFRRHVARDFASMQPTEKRFRPAPPLQEAPAALDFATIQSEIRAALSSAAPPPPRRAGAQLNWTEPGRLAVLSLGAATPAEGLALVRAAGVRCLLAQPGHPFGTAPDLDIVSVPEGMAAAAPLAAKLRARLAAGETLAFHTETGLNGASAMLAARLSARNPTQI